MLYRDVDGLTPLHHAAMFCNYDMISYLIKNGANVNAQSYSLKLTRESTAFYRLLNVTNGITIALMIFFAIHQHNQSSHIHWLEHCNTMMLGRFIDTDISKLVYTSYYLALLLTNINFKHQKFFEVLYVPGAWLDRTI